MAKRMNKKINNLWKIISNPSYRFESFGTRGYYNHLSDEEYIKRMFAAKMGYPLDLNNTRTFNEKLQWLKLYDHKPVYTTMVDKYTAKQYVASIIGKEYIIPTLGVWNSFEEIDFGALPEKFVLKCTHDSGGLVICKDKNQLDLTAAKRKIDKSLKRDYFYFGREWPYKDVKPRIIAEAYLEDAATAELRDYKFFCFDGTVKCFKIDFDRFISHKANYYSKKGELMKVGEEICPPDFTRTISIPPELEKMEELAEKLSAGFPFLRTDFYDVNGRIYFGELTFFPASGFGKFVFEGNDELLGSWIVLPKLRS